MAKYPPDQPVAPLAYNINDAASALGLSRRTIYNLMDQGHLRSFVIGRRRLIPAEDVRALIEKAMNNETINVQTET